MVINAQIVRKLFNKNAANLSSLHDLYEELATRVVSRLDYIKLSPNWIADCGSGLGVDARLLQEKYPLASVIEVDAALNLLKTRLPKPSFLQKIMQKNLNPKLIASDVNNLPLAANSLDLVYANLLLPYLGDPVNFIREIRRVLRIGGAFCLSGLGVDSLKELRSLGLSSFTFPDMHDIGDMLLQAGFSNPVVDTEYLTLDYEDLRTLFLELRLLGCGGAQVKNSPHYLTKFHWQELKSKFNHPQKITLELFVAHGWKDAPYLDLPKGQQIINFKR